MGKQQSVLQYRQIARPKHAEEVSSEESAAFYPWEIMLMIRPMEIDEFTYPHYMYLRGADRQAVAMKAHSLWCKWYKIEKGLEFHRYPDVEEIGTGRGITEQEFAEKWKEAQRYGTYRYLGMRENPGAFSFIREEVMAGGARKLVIPRI